VQFLPKWLIGSTYLPVATTTSDHGDDDFSGFTDERRAEIKAINWLRTGVRLHRIKLNRRSGDRFDAVFSFLTWT